MTFYLGTHMVSWLEFISVPLFVSRRRLAGRRTMPRAVHRWALDSGGFSELLLFGKWQTPTKVFVADVRRIRDEVGLLDWASPQDWMCEPSMLARTGLSIAEHQQRTTENFLRLRDEAPDLPWVPVLQGWGMDDYLRHADEYAHSRVRLDDEPLVAVGTLCRRHATREAEAILRRLSAHGLKLHGFGIKTRGLAAVADILASADSMAWSYRARRSHALPGCVHRSCANCMKYALLWRRDMLHGLHRTHQTALAL